MGSSTLSERSQIILLVLIAVGLGYVFHLYYLGPLGDEVAALDGEIQQLEMEIQQGQAVQAQLPLLKQEVRAQALRLNHLRQVLPDQKETANVIRRVEQLAVEANLKIRSFVPQRTVDRSFYQDWPILVSLEGNYNNLGQFFEKVSQFTRIINVEDLNIRAVGDEGNRSRTLTATCRATTFVYLGNTELDAELAKAESNEFAANY